MRVDSQIALTPASSIKEISKEKKCESVLPKSVGLFSGGLYFFVAEAGGENLRTLFNLEGQSASNAIFGLSLAASVCYGTFTSKTFENLTLKPISGLSWALSALAPFSAASFFTAGIEGTSAFSIPPTISIPIATALFIIKGLCLVDSAVKFPAKYQELINIFKNSVTEKNYLELLKLTVSIYTAVGVAISMTDSIYTAIYKIGTWCSIPENEILDICSYIGGTLGAIGAVPLGLYWTQRGVTQMTNTGKMEEDGSTKDPTDKFTYIAALASIPCILGVMGGTVTDSGGKMFSTLGTFATVVRVSSVTSCSLFSLVPGLATLFRGFASNIPNFDQIKTSILELFNQKDQDELEFESENEKTPLVCEIS